jgi:serine/threonine protein kinase
LTDGENAYLGDFGSAKDDLIGMTSENRTHIRWLAQERFADPTKSFARPTKESDVYEYGSTFLEASTNIRNFRPLILIRFYIDGVDYEWDGAIYKDFKRSQAPCAVGQEGACSL